MRRSLIALATLPLVGALAVLGAASASAADTSTGVQSSVRQLANCDPVVWLNDRAEGTCYDTAFRVGVRCQWVAVQAAYDLPE
jgi:hypothetical protein